MFGTSRHGKNHPSFGKYRSKEWKQWRSNSISVEHRQKQRERVLGKNNPMYGKPSWNKGKTEVYSNETLEKMSIFRKDKFKGEENSNFGNKWSEEQKQAQRDKLNKIKYCPYCNEGIKLTNYGKFHGDKCKFKPF